MIEWWQALLVSLGSSFVVGLTAVAISVLAARANRVVEERRADRKVEEEQRQTIKEIRRPRMQPIIDFLALADRIYARSALILALDTQYNDLEADVKAKFTVEEWREENLKKLGAPPDRMLLREAFVVASSASQRIPGLSDELGRIMVGALAADGSEARARLTPAIMSAEKLIEQYLAGIIQPDETPAEVKE